jgi:hypothetical protein
VWTIRPARLTKRKSEIERWAETRAMIERLKDECVDG